MLKHCLIDLQIDACINVQMYKYTFVKIFVCENVSQVHCIVLYKCTNG